MTVLSDSENIPDEARQSVVVIGNFDGLHKGHQAVIECAKAIARKKNTNVTVLTFEPHPVSVLRPETKPYRLTNSHTKITLLQNEGVDYILPLPFTRELASLSAEAFITDIIIRKLNPVHIVTGYNFEFGHQRSGNTETLRTLSQRHEFGYTAVGAVSGEALYSSSAVRQHLKEGEVAQAIDILGHPPSLHGVVIKGESRGKAIGFPTANIELGEFHRPRYGVYAIRAYCDALNASWNGVANIGIQPTFDMERELLEVHLFECNEPLYNKALLVELYAFIRPEKAFNSLDELKQAIAQDCVIAKETFA